MRRWAVVVLAVGLPLAVAPGVHAQTADEQLSGYVGTASGAIFSVQPVFPGLLPTGDAPFEITGGLTTANVKSGGNAFGQAEVVWPGSAAANMGPLLGQAAGNPIFYQLPPYPLGVHASQDDEAASQGVAPGPVVRASGKDGTSRSIVQAGGGGMPGVFTFGSVSSSSRATVENGVLVTEATVVLHDVVLGAGEATMDAIRSVARATSTGGTSESTGTTNVVGLAIGGQPAVLDGEGLQAAAPLKELLKAGGIELTLVDGSGASDGGAADRVSAGVLATVANPAASANPQFVGSRFVIALGATAVGALANPPFEAADSFDDVDLPGTFDTSGGFSTIAGSMSDVYGSAPVGGAAPAATGGGGNDGALLFDPARRLFEPVGGVPGGLVLALVAAVVFGGRWLSRFVGRFVTSEE